MTVPTIAGRPFTVLGAGTLGRRIALMWLTRGRQVNLYDTSNAALSSAEKFIGDNLISTISTAVPDGKPGILKLHSDLGASLKDSWMVTEAVPEIQELKIDLLGKISTDIDPDTILATNSSSFAGRELYKKIPDNRKPQFISTHYYFPPITRLLEIMVNDRTDYALLDFVAKESEQHGLQPFKIQKDSIGLIGNRIWAAIKREAVSEVASGVASPAEIDRLMSQLLPVFSTPLRSMDGVGLETVRNIENHYQTVYPELKHKYGQVLDCLDNMIADGKLGSKVNQGFYSYVPLDKQQHIVYLDIFYGLVHYRSLDGREDRVIAKDLACPDGVQVASDGSMIVTCMGIPDRNDGYLVRIVPDEAKHNWTTEVIVSPGSTHTPKQVQLDEKNNRIYWCDREGGRIQRCNIDGTGLETLYRTAQDMPRPLTDQSQQCVGISLDKSRGHLYWTQKGSPRGGQGRIFRMNIEQPVGSDVHSRPDVEILWENLPEPIDLAINNKCDTLYWTDRGDGTVNCAPLPTYDILTATPKGPSDRKIVAHHFHQTIGLELDESRGHMYVSDAQGGIYRLNLDGSGRTVLRDSKTSGFTGITLSKGDGTP